jgi:putative hemolysin
MAGFKSKKIFCMGMSRLSGKHCQAKGYPTNSFTEEGVQKYLCRFHGGQNSDYFGFRNRAGKGGFKKENYSHNSRLRQLCTLKQFKDKPIEYVRDYYERNIKERIDNKQFSSEYGRRAACKWQNTYRNFFRSKGIADQLVQISLLVKKARKQGSKD